MIESNNRGNYITLDDLMEGKIEDEATITISRLAVNLRIVELSSSTSHRSKDLLKQLLYLLHMPSRVNHREDIEVHYYLSAKETKTIFQGMKNAPMNSFSISKIHIPRH